VAKALLMSLARNVSTYVSKETIIQDVRMYDSFISIPTFDSYYLALQRIHVMEDLPAWSTHIRSTATLRKSPKRYFVDPSLALTILNVSVAKMKDDLKFVGFVFENEVIKNLRIYAETVGGSLFYFGSSYSTHVDGVRKQKDEEIDVIMELADGN
jgi:predicted AAA+ superfamily ATPase